MELKEIKSIIDLMTKNGLTEFELEKDNVKIRIKRGPEGSTHIMNSASRDNGGNGSPAMPPALPAPAAATAAPVVAPPHTTAVEYKEIKSPMVGTFYRSPSPETPSFVEIGQSVTEDTVVCIIEAMKVMNEIKAEVRGVITEVLVENSKPVEFGKPLFRVKTV
ncbi:MAG: acetyl-CoA carboxylase biotin carboxyl carrier protein [Verrucomicrobia bacterium]|nr:acetyl-CoA carboxylase biotin carboxyl carrier protein [Verrucomicrobiota bacterium]